MFDRAILYYISFKTEMQQKEQNKIAVGEKFLLVQLEDVLAVIL